jgi:hypothetical protein
MMLRGSSIGRYDPSSSKKHTKTLVKEHDVSSWKLTRAKRQPGKAPDGVSAKSHSPRTNPSGDISSFYDRQLAIPLMEIGGFATDEVAAYDLQGHAEIEANVLGSSLGLA